MITNICKRGHSGLVCDYKRNTKGTELEKYGEVACAYELPCPYQEEVI